MKITSSVRSVGKIPHSDLMKLTIDIFKEHKLPVVRQVARSMADDFVEELRFRLASQSFNHRPLNPDYRAQKVEEGKDPRILIATREYMDAIRVHKRVGQDGYYIGFGDEVHSSSGLLMRVLARIHEFGSFKMHIPARPHWRPMASIYRLRSVQYARRAGSSLYSKVLSELNKNRR